MVAWGSLGVSFSTSQSWKRGPETGGQNLNCEPFDGVVVVWPSSGAAIHHYPSKAQPSYSKSPTLQLLATFMDRWWLPCENQGSKPQMAWPLSLNRDLNVEIPPLNYILVPIVKFLQHQVTFGQMEMTCHFQLNIYRIQYTLPSYDASDSEISPATCSPTVLTASRIWHP